MLRLTVRVILELVALLKGVTRGWCSIRLAAMGIHRVVIVVVVCREGSRLEVVGQRREVKASCRRNQVIALWPACLDAMQYRGLQALGASAWQRNKDVTRS